MLAIALGLEAVDAGHRVYYTTAAELVARTSKAAAEGRWAATMRFWAGPAVLIVDELGYLPMPGEAASHLFQVISRRCPRPPTSQGDGDPHRRRELPDAGSPGDAQRATGGSRRGWGNSVIVSGEFS